MAAPGPPICQAAEDSKLPLTIKFVSAKADKETAAKILRRTDTTIRLIITDSLLPRRRGSVCRQYSMGTAGEGEGIMAAKHDSAEPTCPISFSLPDDASDPAKDVDLTTVRGDKDYMARG